MAERTHFIFRSAKKANFSPKQFTLIVNDEAFTFFLRCEHVNNFFHSGKVVMLQKVAVFEEAGEANEILGEQNTRNNERKTL